MKTPRADANRYAMYRAVAIVSAARVALAVSAEHDLSLNGWIDWACSIAILVIVVQAAVRDRRERLGR